MILAVYRRVGEARLTYREKQVKFQKALGLADAKLRAASDRRDELFISVNRDRQALDGLIDKLQGDERTMARLEELVPQVQEEVGINVAVSAGILTSEQARRLAAVGVHRYNHNLETAKSFFGRIVTTHSWDERFATCRLVRAQGMELCCGVLLGMGETDEQRLELIAELQAVEPCEVPLNFLNPRPGTPLGDRPLVGALEAIRWIALFRLGLPEVILRYAGGREVTLRELQVMGLTAGINALIVGNYLTTLGRSPEEDLQMLEDLRMPIGALSKVI